MFDVDVEANYGGRNWTYWIDTQHLSVQGINANNLIVDGYVTLGKVDAIFGDNKSNGYKST